MRARQLLIMTVALAMEIVAGVASAQMPNGAFERLTPGHQRIARALHEAQRPNAGRRLSVDEIAARHGDQGWNGVFREMKAQGLVTEKTLTHVVDRHEGRTPAR